MSPRFKHGSVPGSAISEMSPLVEAKLIVLVPFVQDLEYSEEYLGLPVVTKEEELREGPNGIAGRYRGQWAENNP